MPLLETALCYALLYQGTHALECKVEYIHTTETGERYYHQITKGYFSEGNVIASCTGQGFPVRVTLKDLGSVVCQSEVSLFEDGFESGSTSAWASAAP